MYFAIFIGLHRKTGKEDQETDFWIVQFKTIPGGRVRRLMSVLLPRFPQRA
jgi:hypothetical protein